MSADGLYVMADGGAVHISVRIERSPDEYMYGAEEIALAAAVRALEGQQRKPEPFWQMRRLCKQRHPDGRGCRYYWNGFVAIPPCAEYRCPRLRGEV
jgi:hypothetical protein